MTFKELKEQSDKITKYIFFGEEKYLFEDFLHHLKKKLNPSFRDFNFVSISQDKTDYIQALSHLESVPMMDVKKIICFSNFITRETSKSLWSKKEMDAFIQRVENADQSTYLVMYVGNEDRKNASYKKLSSLCTVFELKKLNEKELAAYVRYYCKKLNVEPEEEFISLYLKISAYHDKNAERNLYDINSDLEKLCAFLSKKGSITSEEMVSLVGDTETADIFALADAVLSKDMKRSLELYELLKKKDNSPKLALSLLSLLTSALSTYLYALNLIPKGYSQSTIAKELDVHPFRLKKALELKKRYSKVQAYKTFENLLALDQRFKSGNLPQDMMGELMIFEVCAKEEPSF